MYQVISSVDVGLRTGAIADGYVELRRRPGRYSRTGKGIVGGGWSVFLCEGGEDGHLGKGEIRAGDWGQDDYWAAVHQARSLAAANDIPVYLG